MGSGHRGSRSSSAQAPRSQRYRRRTLALPEGGSLVLNGDGSINQVDAAGAISRSWSQADAEWPRMAIRFGLHPEGETTAPHRVVPGEAGELRP